MTIESAADRAALFDTDDFAIAVIYTPRGYPHPSSVSATINGIFDRAYVSAGGIEGYAPVLLVDDSDLFSNIKGGKVICDGDIYTIKEYQPDGTGLATLILELQ
jgi:hypothetical protein